jgi:hypothetical protein
MKQFVRHEEDKCAGVVKDYNGKDLCDYHFGIDQEAKYLGRMG